ncbi:MAG TPA: class I tRNA ligase family protein, partial [Terriglobales bacterium]|nr:class I tRNA ligase family protein [Terriglobales bacterium]
LGFLMYVFENALRLLSPFMPFITEEIWHAVYEGKSPLKSIALAEYPRFLHAAIDADAEDKMSALQELVGDIREHRALKNVPLREPVPVRLWISDLTTEKEVLRTTSSWHELIEGNNRTIRKLANVSEFQLQHQPIPNAVALRPRWNARFDLEVIYDFKVDVPAERERLSKELKKLEGEMASIQRNLANEQFISKAPPHILDGARKREAELSVLIGKNRSALSRLG